MKIARRSVLLPALALPMPEGGPTGGPPAPPPKGLATPGAEDDPDREKWKPKADTDFDQRLLPPHLRDENSQKVIEKLYGAYKPLREAQSQRGSPPAKAEEYKIQLDDKLAKRFTDLDNDPAYKALRDTLFEAKFSQKDFEAVAPKLLARLAEAMPQAEEITLDGEAKKLGVKPEEGQQRYKAAGDFLTTAKANKVFGDKTDLVVAELELMRSSAEGVLIIELLQKGRQEQGPGGGGTPAEGITWADIKKRMQDDRYLHGPKHDPAFRKETDKLNQAYKGPRT